jgi:hypothetical protein
MKLKLFLVTIVLFTSSLALAGFPCTGPNGQAGTSLSQGGFCYYPLPAEEYCLQGIITDEPVSMCAAPVAGGNGGYNPADIVNLFVGALQLSKAGRVNYNDLKIEHIQSLMGNLVTNFVKLERATMRSIQIKNDQSLMQLNRATGRGAALQKKAIFEQWTNDIIILVPKRTL